MVLYLLCQFNGVPFAFIVANESISLYSFVFLLPKRLPVEHTCFGVRNIGGWGVSFFPYIGSNHLQNLTGHFCQVTFLREVKVFIQNRYSMKTYYSLLSYALVTLNHVVNVNYFSPTHFSTGVETGLARNSKENNVFS